MLKVQNLQKTFTPLPEFCERKLAVTGFTSRRGGVPVLDQIDLEVNRGEFVVIFGPNGCGKTTLLNIIAGLEKADAGLIKRQELGEIGFIFQNFREALFPWLRIGDNIALPLTLKGQGPEMRRARVINFLKEMNATLDLKAYPYQLSSGQQQLVAILRGIIEPVDLLLMDEPFNSLDYRTTLLMEQKLLELWQKMRFTVLFVTHAAGEAVLLADRILVMSDKPSKIVAEIPVKLPRPRPYQTITTPEFNRIKQQVIDLLIKSKEKKV